MNYKYQSNKYFNHIFMIPPERYIENLKKLYIKYGSKQKSLKELKKLALMEAKKASVIIGKISKESRLEIILAKDIVLKVLEMTYESINTLFVKINHNFKNERRKVYDDNEKYLEVIRKYETNKLKLFRYTIKNVCKNSKISFDSLEKSIFHYLECNDIEVIELLNKSSSLGKHFAIPPQCLGLKEIIEILQKYYQSLQFIVMNTDNSSSDLSKYAMIIVADIVYEHFGLEEEQIFNSVTSRQDLRESKEVLKYLSLIKGVVMSNLQKLFEL